MDKVANCTLLPLHVLFFHQYERFYVPVLLAYGLIALALWGSFQIGSK